jgi:hypothetical protein
VRQVANEIAIELADDGAGLNLEGVRAKAVAQGGSPPMPTPPMPSSSSASSSPASRPLPA